MATGYTARLHDGEQDPKEFILLCSRAFGALIHQRDDGSDILPKHDEARSSYYDGALARDQEDIIRLRDQTDKEAEAEALAEYEAAVESWHKENVRMAAMKARYEAMLTKVKAWTPPSSDHEGLKTFMIDQLVDSIKFDCTRSSYDTEPVLRPWMERRAELLQDAYRNIEHYAAKIAEENDRVAGRNKWIDDLYESVKDL